VGLLTLTRRHIAGLSDVFEKLGPFFLTTMTDDGWIWTHETVIPSHQEASRQVVREILDRLQKDEWIEQEIFAIHLSLEEAMVNAIKHGNGYDTRKTVHVVYRISKERFQIEITDEGDGFDPDGVPDPTNDNHLNALSGRGVHLIRSYMSEVKYNEIGNSVMMEKLRTA